VTSESRTHPVREINAPTSSRPVSDAALRQARWLLITVAVGTTLAPLNSTMIAVALPDI
jgi:hypothetical protein